MMKQMRGDRPAPSHIGIVACSAEGASLCYRTICQEGASLLGKHGHPEISLHTHALADYVRCLEQGDWLGVAALMRSSAQKLAACGAELLICPDNTIHQAFELVAPQVPLPWLHIAAVVADEAAARGFHRLGILGTRWLVESEVYPAQLDARGIAWARPGVADRDTVDHLIMDELVTGVFRPAGMAVVQQVMQRLQEGGCDAVVLGCTELPLLVADTPTPLPTLDSTRLLARAALRSACS
jgi:aspartate racemase